MKGKKNNRPVRRFLRVGIITLLIAGLCSGCGGIGSGAASGEDLAVEDTAYDSVLQEYKQACAENSAEWLNAPEGFEEKYPDVDPLVMLNYHTAHANQLPDEENPFMIGGMYYDIDHDGDLELVLLQIQQYVTPFAIFVNDNDRPSELDLCDKKELAKRGETAKYNIYSNGVINVNTGDSHYYRLEKKDHKPKPVTLSEKEKEELPELEVTPKKEDLEDVSTKPEADKDKKDNKTKDSPEDKSDSEEKPDKEKEEEEDKDGKEDNDDKEEKKISFDKEKYVQAVNELLEAWREVESSEGGSSSYSEIPEYSTTIPLGEDGNRLYYGCYDFDKNGTDEVVIAAGDGSYHQPVGIYAFDGKKMVYLCKKMALGDRCSIADFSDGIFTLYGSGGATVGGIAIYRIGDDGYSTDYLNLFEYEFKDEDTVEIDNEIGDMDSETFLKKKEDIFSGTFDVPIDYKLLGEGDDSDTEDTEEQSGQEDSEEAEETEPSEEKTESETSEDSEDSEESGDESEETDDEDVSDEDDEDDESYEGDEGDEEADTDEENGDEEYDGPEDETDDTDESGDWETDPEETDDSYEENDL